MIIDENNKGMGSVSIFKDGQEVYQNSIGYADISKEIKADNQTKYRIGSISKTFTATIIVMMIEEGKLNYTDYLSSYIPDVPNASKITIEQLLRHRSGLFNLTSATDFFEYADKPMSRKKLLAKIIENGTIFEPGERAMYSNTNYVLLTMIAEKIDEKTFDQLFEDRITKPLGLNNTHYGSKIDVSKNEALSYVKKGEWDLSMESDMSIPLGAGGIVSTAADLNKFMYALFKGQIVSDSSVKKMMELKDNYGMGLFRFPFYSNWAFGHNGGIDGFQSNSVYFPDFNVNVTYLSNGVDMPINDVLIGVLSIYFGKTYELPVFTPSLKLDSEVLDQYLGVYSKESFPIKLTITKDNNTLIGQASGQPTFPLEAYEEHKFRFDQAKLKIEFVPSEDKLILMQGGGAYELFRE